jgi:hypothetical protein
MCTKWFSDGEVHKYFTPYSSPYEAFINYMNVLSDFMIRVNDVYGAHQVTIPLVASAGLAEKKSKKSGRTVSAAACKFDDLGKLSPIRLKELLNHIDLETLACALINCDASLKDKVMKSLSKKDHIRFEALSDSLIKSKKTEINLCRQKLSSIMSGLL